MLNTRAIEIRSSLNVHKFTPDPYIHPMEMGSSVNAQSAQYALDTRLRMYLQATGARSILE